ncbi:MAG: hypothetical protein WCK86_10220 [Planctomycetia bacterium]
MIAVLAALALLISDARSAPVGSMTMVRASAVFSQADEKQAAQRPVASAFVRTAPAVVNERLIGWLAKSQVERSVAEKALQLWSDQTQVSAMTAEETLDRLVESFALADDNLRKLMGSCRTGAERPELNFEGPRNEPFFRQHVQLWYGRWLAQHRYYDESLAMLDSLSPDKVIDPAGLLFYRASSRLRLLRASDAADDLTLLLNNTLDVPPRFRLVAGMMLQEAKPAEGLPRVAQLMSDVQRRLDLGKSGEPVQKREEEVIAALDKLLKNLEEQQQQQQQSSGQSDGQGQMEQGIQNTSPASQSMIKGAAGKGDAERRELTENGAWGMLDKQQETQAKELIRQQFPPNFLDAISRYTRRIAEQKK